MLKVRGSRVKDTYNELRLDGRWIGNFWGRITSIEPESTGIGLFVCINGTEIFLHEVGEVILNDFLTGGITCVISLVRSESPKSLREADNG